MFNQQTHLFLQHTENWHSFSVLNKKYKSVGAIIYIHIDDTIASSPLRSTFGSYEISRELPAIILFQFLEFVDSRLKAKGVTKFILKEPPSSYYPNRSALLHTFLFNLGYQVSDAEVSAVIHVSENSFQSYPDSSERRRLRQCHDAGLQVKQLSHDSLGDVYLFILACRKQRGYSLSMTLSELKTAVNRFKDNYLLFGVFKEEQLVAASIAVQVRKNILYNFYPAHAKEFDHLSPVVFLMEGMYKFCQLNKIDLLDLGTSAIEGKPNFGLIDFKLRLGARPSTKLTFVKKF